MEVKQALFETVNNLLTPNNRKLAEQQLQALEVTDEYGVYLMEMTLDAQGSLPVRQMAALLLKQYVDTHWSEDADKFRPPEATPQAKAIIRKHLPMGLKESISKVRSSVAYTIAAVAHWDWPEQWPELFDILMLALKDPSEFAVHGAVRVLKEFTRDLTDNQIPHVAPVILPDMYRIFMEQDSYSVRTRARAVEIFTTLANMICTIGEVNKGFSKSLLGPVLPTFTEALVSALNVPDESRTSDAGLKTEVLKALTLLVRNVPKAMAPWLAQILPPVWSTLTSSAAKYVKEVVNQSGDEEEVVDSDGEVVGFENLVFAIFEFVQALVETPKFRGSVKAGLSELMYYIVLYMQITEEQCEKWSENPDQFVEDEDEDSFAYTVRISAQDLLMALCEEFAEECCVSLAQTIERHLSEANPSANPHWWKSHEAIMLSLGSAKEVIEGQIQAGKVKFDIASFLENVVLSDAANPASPFLFGRCLWIGSKFPGCLSQAAMRQFLEATVRGLMPDQMPVVRISAVRAIWGFCSHLRSSTPEQRQTLMRPVLPAATDALLQMCTAFNHSSEVLGLVMENMTIILTCDKAFTASVESKISPLTIAIFLKYSSDPVITSLAQDIFKVLSLTEGCLEPLQNRIVPTLVSILDAPNDKVAPGLRAVALDVLGTLVRSSTPPLSPLLMNSGFPSTVHCVMRTDDNSTLQSGGECLRAFISVSPGQICAYADSEGKSGLWYLVQVASQLLNPVGSEFSATFVGRLVTTLIRRTGDRLGQDLDHLLKAVLSKLQSSETLSVIQSLLMVYAQLIHTQLDAVLNFLHSVPGPKGETALHFVLTEWVSRQHIFYGAYENKVTIVALSKLLLHGVNTNDPRLNGITVRGDQLITDSGRTRSQRKLRPAEWTMIPVLVKIFKLLVHEMTTNLEAMANESEDDTDDDEDDENIDDGGMTNGRPKTVELSKLLSDDSAYEDDELGEEDPDAKNDPIYQINLKRYLAEFLVEFCKQPYFAHFAPHLNIAERSAINTLGIQL